MFVTILVALSSPAHAQTLSLDGTCDGEIAASIEGLTPDGRFAVVGGKFGGAHTVPEGPCAGLELDLLGLEAVAVSSAGRDGTAAASPRIGCGACEGTLQIVDLETCTAGPPVHVPGSCDPDHDLLFTVLDYDTRAPVVDADFSVGDDVYDPDDDGSAVIPIEPEAPVEIRVEAPGYPVHRYARVGTTYVRSATVEMTSSATLDLLGLLFGISVDDSRAVLSVAIFEYAPVGAFPDVPGVTVSPGAAYDLALAADASSPFGLSVGNTTLEGSTSVVSFANVEPGPTRIDLDIPDGYDCRWQKDVVLRAGERTTVTATCNEPL